jgi:TMEM175 potassium channel family protein
MRAEETVDKALGKSRLEALSDGVFAIAMTLLVLEIRMPDVSKAISPDEIREVMHGLRGLGPVFFSFVLTFVLAGSFWFQHHVTFQNTRYLTRGLVAINILFLMFVSLLPFSTGTLGRLGLGHPIALAVYFGNQLALSLALNLHWRYARTHGLLVSPLIDPQARFMIASQPFCLLMALLAVAVFPPAGYWVFAIMIAIVRRVARRRFKALPADAPAPL